MRFGIEEITCSDWFVSGPESYDTDPRSGPLSRHRSRGLFKTNTDSNIELTMLFIKLSFNEFLCGTTFLYPEINYQAIEERANERAIH